MHPVAAKTATVFAETHGRGDAGQNNVVGEASGDQELAESGLTGSSTRSTGSKHDLSARRNLNKESEEDRDKSNSKGELILQNDDPNAYCDKK